MADKIPRLFTVALAALLGAGCATTPTPQPGPQPDLSAAGATLLVAQVRPEPATSTAISARANGIAAVLIGADGPVVNADEVSRALSATPGQADLLVESFGRISLHVDARQSDLLVVNGAVADDTTSTGDIGPVRARAVFEETLKVLVSRQLVDPDGLAIVKVRTGRMMQAETRRGGDTIKSVKEYFFEVPRVIGGVEVFGASVTVSVHRSGRVASIRVVGPLVSASNDSFKRVLSAASLSERARRENPSAEVTPMGLRYAWKAERADAAVLLRPRETFRVVPVTTVEERTTHGRTYYVFYAVDNERESPIVWPRPNPNATGDARK